MSKDTQDKLIDAAKLLVLVGIGAALVAAGHETAGTGVIMGGLGHAIPSRRRAVQS